MTGLTVNVSVFPSVSSSVAFFKFAIWEKYEDEIKIRFE